MIVREATLDDTRDIVAVHLTNPDRPFDRPVESLSIAERIGHGGPWMSVESCAIHLNNLLAWGYAPLVVEDEGQVIAETEFYIGRDIPPLGTTLDISVLYVHLDFQRQGAGSLLMEEMIARARNAGCDHITVSGGVGSPEFYGRFGFSHALDLQVINRDVPLTTGPCARKPYVPGDFQAPPDGTLWIGRYLSPTQKWREIVDGIKKRDAVLSEHTDRPELIGTASRSDGVLGLCVPEHQRKGIGAALVTHLERKARKIGLKKIRLHTVGGAEWAVFFCRKLGYEPADRLEQPWGLDVFMEKELPLEGGR